MLKKQMSEPMYPYRYQVGQVMTTNLLSSEFQNPHVVDTTAAGFSVAIPRQSTLYGT